MAKVSNEVKQMEKPIITDDYLDLIELLHANKVWPTKSGELMPLKDMSLAHIANCMALILQHNWRATYLPLFKQELIRRVEEAEFNYKNVRANISRIINM